MARTALRKLYVIRSTSCLGLHNYFSSALTEESWSWSEVEALDKLAQYRSSDGGAFYAYELLEFLEMPSDAT
jgi:hypothetical protein